jgi:hypothetical protein
MHAMNPMVAVTRVSPIAAEIFPKDIKGMSPPYQSPQILPDSRSAEKKVQS